MNSFRFGLIFFVVCVPAPADAASDCTTQIQAALEAEYLLVENNLATSISALQGLAEGYLKFATCSAADIQAVMSPKYSIEKFFSGREQSSFGFIATTKGHRCQLSFSIDTPQSKLKNIGFFCNGGLP